MQTLAVEGIHKQFGGVQALRDVSLTLNAGTVHAVVGENGAGKSTLIKILMGVVTPDAGRILLDGRPVFITSPVSARALGFAAVFQEPLVFPHLTVLENLFLGQLPRTRWGNVDRRAMRERIAPILDRLGVDPALLDLPMVRLSVGQQQLILVAEALVHQARVILFDEPTSSLSQLETRHLLHIIRDLRKAGHAIGYISHRLEELAGLADMVTVLTDGRVVGRFGASGWTPDSLVALMSGGRRAGTAPKTDSVLPVVNSAETADHRPVLEVQNLSGPGFSRVSFQVAAGEILGFYGQVGAGRSELMQALFGYRPIRSGRILLERRAVTVTDPRAAIRLGIAYLPEDRQAEGLFPSQSITRNMVVVLLHALARRGGQVDQAAARRTVDRWVARLDLKLASPDDPVSSLSGGGQQKVLFARWLAVQGIRVFLFDEPTRGIDVATKREVHAVIRQLAAAGAAVVVVSSDLEEVVELSTRLLVMRNGQLVREFPDRSALTADAVLAASIGVIPHEEAPAREPLGGQMTS
ncbi:MAG: sugar ABC transporter ATP-binding protein [Firmicutes bacterium]|nr:sugar ABC transporter ATP-binding protein [Bacillota bacterium]